jgi:galactitol-specific phosphotransferase system IIB component
MEEIPAETAAKPSPACDDHDYAGVRKRRDVDDSVPLKRTKANELEASYKASDCGPFEIHVQKIFSDNKSSPLHPITFGNFLSRNKIKNILPGGVKPLGKFRISVQFKDFKSANEFVSSVIIKNNNYKAFIPMHQVTRMGLIKGVPVDMSDEEIISECRVPERFGKILKIRRLNYKDTKSGPSVTWKPSQSVVVTFEGQALPSHVYLHYNSLPVEKYIFPTVQCFQCCRFGHTKTVCRSLPRCFKCTESHLGENCSSFISKCVNCQGSHTAINTQCPEFLRQKRIKNCMAMENISYFEAARSTPLAKPSFAEKASSPPPSLNSSCVTEPKPSTSTKKSIFTFRTPKSPENLHLLKDRDSLNSILISPDGNIPNTSANGVAFAQCDQIQENSQDLLKTVLNLLLNIIVSQRIPSNAADIITNLLQSFNNGSNTSMEQQKCSIQ